MYHVGEGDRSPAYLYTPKGGCHLGYNAGSWTHSGYSGISNEMHNYRIVNRVYADGTNMPHLYVDECLKRLGVYELFDNVWTIEDFARTKNDPVIYQEAAQRLGTTVENCVFVDDNLTAITTAKTAGMQTIAVYDALSEAFMAQMQETADQYVMDFSQIRTDCHR
jgi:beta-phosphoglucomutase-like phosphatase (HAD superfamily)